MSEMKFTAGPWKAENGGVYAHESELARDVIVADCVCEQFQRRAPREHIEANAVLIAAAPDPFAACKRAFDELKLSRDYALYDDETRALVAALDAALAKASPQAVSENGNVQGVK